MSDPVLNPAGDPLSDDALDDNSPGLIEYLSTGAAGGVVLTLLVVVCYAATAKFNYIWCDDVNVALNGTLRTFGGLSRIWTDLAASPQFMPVTYSSFWAEVRLFGLNPVVSHVINIALHATNVLLLWTVLRRLSVPGAWAAAAIFAVHPLHTQAVAWVSQRSTLLSLTFGLAATLFFVRQAIDFVPVVIEGEAKPEGVKFGLPEHAGRLYALFFAMFALALLSRPSMAVLPVVLAVVLWWKKGGLNRREILSLAAPLLLGAVVAAITTHIEHDPSAVGTSGPEWGLSVVQKLMLAGQTAGFYLAKLAAPYPLQFVYPRWTVAPSNVLLWLPLLGIAALVAVSIALKNLAGRGLPAAVLIFVIAILPASGLVSFYMMRFAWVWDHQAYAAAVAPIALVAAGVTLVTRRLPPAVPAAITAAVVVAFAILTATEFRLPPKEGTRPAAIFSDNRALWETTLQQNEHAWIAAAEFGRWAIGKSAEDYAAFMAVGDPKRAASERKIALERSRIWLNFAIKLNPDCYEAYTYRGRLNLQEQNPVAALADFDLASSTAARMGANAYIDPEAMVADVLTRRGDDARARTAFEALQQDEPRLAARQPTNFARLRMQYGDLLLRQLKSPPAPNLPDADQEIIQQAINQYSEAGIIAPDYIPAKLRLATLLSQIDQSNAALEQLRDVLELDRNNRDAKYLAAVVAEKIGDYEASGAQLVNLLRLDPRYMPAHIKLAEVYERVGRHDEAINELKATLQFAPNYQAAKDLLAKLTGPAPSASSQPATAPASTPDLLPAPQ